MRVTRWWSARKEGLLPSLASLHLAVSLLCQYSFVITIIVPPAATFIVHMRKEKRPHRAKDDDNAWIESGLFGLVNIEARELVHHLLHVPILWHFLLLAFPFFRRGVAALSVFIPHNLHPDRANAHAHDEQVR
jgi:hypothetical protein